MRYLSLFSGIEAATVAWHPLGWECAAVAEIEPFPCAVLAHHYPDVPNLGSVTGITEAQIKALGHIDIVVFGSPCQDLSVAGHRKGLINADDGTVTRSGLFFTAINIARWSGARFWLWENVPGAFSSNKGRDFAAVVEFMAGLDAVDVPPRGWATEGVAVGDNGLLEWAVLDAQWFGVAQRRRRVFALADLGDWANRPPILLEPEGLRGDSAPRREAGEAGEGVTGSTATSTFECGGIGRYSRSSSSSPLLKTGADLGNGAEALITLNDTTGALNSGGGKPGQGYPAALTAMQVRRLTPVECERLQGFPDGYTNIPWRKQPTAPDGPRYKALGNSMAVPVMRWIGKQIQNGR